MNNDNCKNYSAPDLKKDLNLVTVNNEKYIKLSSLGKNWLTEVLACLTLIPKEKFVLEDIYNFIDIFKQKHPNNNTIEAKIRQQLQFLRDNDLIEFDDKQGHFIKHF